MANEILRIENLMKGFGGLQAVDDCSLTVQEGTIMGLIGPNGAGKSTLFDPISGFARHDAGRIIFSGREIIGLPAHSEGKPGNRSHSPFRQAGTALEDGAGAVSRAF